MACKHLGISWNTLFYKWDVEALEGLRAEFRSLPSPPTMCTVWYLNYISVNDISSTITVQLCRENSGKKLHIRGIVYYLFKYDTIFKRCLDYIMDSDTKHVTILENTRYQFPEQQVMVNLDAWITELTETEEKSVQPLSTFPKLLCDMHEMYEKQDHSDLIVICKGVKIRVHKCVLSARSPVFAKMFQQVTTESNDNRIDITDIDPDILEELLKFFYCGKINPSSYSRAHDLYFAAEKYFVSDLKDMCRDIIISYLTITSAVETLILADKHKDKEMMQKAITFIASSFQYVKSTEPWIILQQENSPLATKVLSEVVEKSHSKHSDSV
ncbi:BTB/POZ domain-containing protein At1g01640-like [Stegodyphus dumicola]|uniref:BTB/POZ domain-containing protein At1g01640-like n=1 Tax=Stegodyphus dumicola TaxID=202533 RepID=UPI0015A83036|nr:BTB/POZ domain-containing protein At1g01640-like [Stegodyphus dumicola]